MEKMIQEYEQCRVLLERRMRQIAAALQDPGLRTREREALERRRELLMYERFDLLHAIREMKEHLHSEEGTDGKKNRPGGKRASDKRYAGGAGRKPGAARSCKRGAAGRAAQ
ncbi:MAG: hypothetical protein K5695_15240 [Oscillospiraceae bacterium]|nr:hypothetical protein [Oscillospiraceae bacterium]